MCFVIQQPEHPGAQPERGQSARAGGRGGRGAGAAATAGLQRRRPIEPSGASDALTKEHGQHQSLARAKELSEAPRMCDKIQF